MRKTFLLQTLLWCLVLGLALATFAQEKTRVDSRLSASNTQSNAQSQTIIPDLATIVRYDDGLNDNSIGLTSGGTFEVSARFRPDQLGTLTGQGVTQVEIYINDGVSAVVVKIYGAGTPSLPGPVLYSQSHPVTQMSWNLITLGTPVTVDGNDLWVGYEVTHGGGTFPAGLDETPPLDVDGDWIYFQAAWAHLAGFGLPGDWNIAAYVEPIGPPCPVGAPTNPNPPSGTTGVPISGNTATWTNGAGTTQVELWFGPTGSLTQVYLGPTISSFALPTLEYLTEYGWYVKCWNDTCFTQGPTWTFTTIQNPDLVEWCDEFATINNWTIIGPLGIGNWSAAPSSLAGGTAPELRMSWTPSFNGVSKIRSTVLPGGFLNNWLTNYSFNYYFDYFGAPSGTVTVAVTYDGGATSSILYNQVDAPGNVGPLVVAGTFTTPASGAANMQLEITFSGNSFNNDNIFWDNLCIFQIVPVELTSFTARADYGVVELSWITATETNNQGFEVQRSAGGEFETIAFVEGHGTTTQIQAYSYSDRSVNVGTYSYRLKQIDFGGTFEYSDVISADVPALAEFALDQNYPNPFNPSTKIAFRLAVDSKVSLKVFDILGQEVANLVNANLGVGAHSINFDASSLNSGVYFYRIEATGVNGTNFVDVKKMILTK